MKRWFAVFLLVCLIISLCACSGQEETADFYYLRSEYLPGTADGVIAPEKRAISEDRGLNYNLRLYLEGPASEQFFSPFPKGMYLLSTKLDQDLLQVFVSPEFFTLEDLDLTLACACLARTCFVLSDAQQIQIISDGSQTITLTKDSFTLLDDASVYETIP